MNVATIRKAIVAGLAAAAAFAVPIVDDGLLWSEALGILLAGLTAAGVTWAVPNRPTVSVLDKAMRQLDEQRYAAQHRAAQHRAGRR